MRLIFRNFGDSITEFSSMLQKYRIHHRVIVQDIVYIIQLRPFSTFKNIKVRLPAPKPGQGKIRLNAHGTYAKLFRDFPIYLFYFRTNLFHKHRKKGRRYLFPIDLKTFAEILYMRTRH